jgi:hypothetical protein
MADIIAIKISDLPEAASNDGVKVPGLDTNLNNIKVDLSNIRRIWKGTSIPSGMRELDKFIDLNTGIEYTLLNNELVAL